MESTNNIFLLIRNKAWYLFLLSLFFISCQNNDDVTFSPDDLLIGNWVNLQFNQTTRETIFIRANHLIDNEYGISFKKNDDFIERTSGFCGTPPIVFQDMKGLWIKHINIITISHNNFPNDYQFEIVSLTKDTLVVKRL